MVNQKENQNNKTKHVSQKGHYNAGPHWCEDLSDPIDEVEHPFLSVTTVHITSIVF